MVDFDHDKGVTSFKSTLFSFISVFSLFFRCNNDNFVDKIEIILTICQFTIKIG